MKTPRLAKIQLKPDRDISVPIRLPSEIPEM
jgi:hypothetical protein